MLTLRFGYPRPTAQGMGAWSAAVVPKAINKLQCLLTIYHRVGQTKYAYGTSSGAELQVQSS